MFCKNCGKALGNNSSVCPFCGAMMSKEQIEVYAKEKKEKFNNSDLLTEKYGQKFNYEKREGNNSLMFVILGIVLVLVFLIIVTVISMF